MGFGLNVQYAYGVEGDGFHYFPGVGVSGSFALDFHESCGIYSFAHLNMKPWVRTFDLILMCSFTRLLDFTACYMAMSTD